MAYSKRREEKKEIDVDQVVTFLSSAFNKATYPLGFKNNKGTDLYDLQTEMAWMLHEIQMGPRYIAAKRIQEANEFIESIIIDE